MIRKENIIKLPENETICEPFGKKMALVGYEDSKERYHELLPMNVDRSKVKSYCLPPRYEHKK